MKNLIRHRGEFEIVWVVVRLHPIVVIDRHALWDGSIEVAIDETMR